MVSPAGRRSAAKVERGTMFLAFTNALNHVGNGRGSYTHGQILGRACRPTKGECTPF